MSSKFNGEMAEGQTNKRIRKGFWMEQINNGTFYKEQIFRAGTGKKKRERESESSID